MRDLHKDVLKTQWTRSTAEILISDKHLFFYFFIYFVFSALIDNTSNFENDRLIRLVVSGMFLLPYFASLMSDSSC